MYLTAWSETQYSVFSFVVSHNHKTTHAHTLINIWKIHGEADHLSIVVEPFVCFDMRTFYSETEVNSEVTSAVFQKDLQLMSWGFSLGPKPATIWADAGTNLSIFRHQKSFSPWLLSLWQPLRPSAPPPDPNLQVFCHFSTDNFTARVTEQAQVRIKRWCAPDENVKSLGAKSLYVSIEKSTEVGVSGTYSNSTSGQMCSLRALRSSWTTPCPV